MGRYLCSFVWHCDEAWENVDFYHADGFQKITVINCTEHNSKRTQLNGPSRGDLLLKSHLLLRISFSLSILTVFSFLILGSTRELIYRLRKQRSVEVGSSWKQFTRTENTMTLEYAYKVECDKYYYGAGCVSFCRPRDDQFGHYVCDENGEKVCMQGWKGDYCDQGTQNYMTSSTHSDDKTHSKLWQKSHLIQQHTRDDPKICHHLPGIYSRPTDKFLSH